MMWMWDNYTTDPKERKVYASPLQATSNQLKGLPPALVTNYTNIFRDEGEYARKLDEAGVKLPQHVIME
jgi:acetyl esterase/lipase